MSVHIDSPPAHHFVSIFWKPRFVATTHCFAAMLHLLDHEGKGSLTLMMEPHVALVGLHGAE